MKSTGPVMSISVLWTVELFCKKGRKCCVNSTTGNITATNTVLAKHSGDSETCSGTSRLVYNLQLYHGMSWSFFHCFRSLKIILQLNRTFKVTSVFLGFSHWVGKKQSSPFWNTCLDGNNNLSPLLYVQPCHGST